jgi:hypothetical protein
MQNHGHHYNTYIFKAITIANTSAKPMIANGAGEKELIVAIISLI